MLTYREKRWGSGKEPNALNTVFPEMFTSQLGNARTRSEKELPRKKGTYHLMIERAASMPTKNCSQNCDKANSDTAKPDDAKIVNTFFRFSFFAVAEKATKYNGMDEERKRTFRKLNDGSSAQNIENDDINTKTSNKKNRTRVSTATLFLKKPLKSQSAKIIGISNLVIGRSMLLVGFNAKLKGSIAAKIKKSGYHMV
ncbi:MAG: hypothetical protein U9M90_01700 [Patescibacteria group bacterium]|nr:hypothetical protein [Patescibacteria group bacterium]